MSEHPLNNRRALVTGASRGIGQAIALALAEAGANVVVSARSLPPLEEVATAIRQMGRECLVVPCDVADPQQVATLASTIIEAWGGVDILVNNAGVAGSHKFLNHPDELWHRMLAVNLTGVYYVTKALVPPMVSQKWGRIINIASIAGKTGARYIAAYSASKHGVLGFTRSLAMELVDYQITVNAICPGYVETPMTETNIANIAARTGMSPAQVRHTLAHMSPQGRLIEPEEVAALTVYLARDEARGITGQAINVDGGTVQW
ncbi:MAG: SDR family NAD(P)-dependent oxidoreductase [Ardenticatenia bacterium]|nr:SDR family NAD(P)-dependent oxidoreductase [Ardenticatenia bacterium]